MWKLLIWHFTSWGAKYYHRLNGHEFEQNPGRQWNTGKPSVLLSAGSQRDRHSLATKQQRLSNPMCVGYRAHLHPSPISRGPESRVSPGLCVEKQSPEFRDRICNLTTLNILCQLILCYGDCPLHCRMFRSLFGFFQSMSVALWVVRSKHVSRHY